MAYAARNDLEDAFGGDELTQLTDRTGAGLADSNLINAALAWAGDAIDGYLAPRYALPLATVPERLKGLACDIARYRLCEDAVPDVVRDRYTDAIAWLRDLSAGRAQLPGAATPPAGGAGLPASTAPAVVFGDLALAGL